MGTTTTATIAVIDDDVSVLHACRRLLGAAGFAVETFSSARAFFDRPLEWPIACVVVDLMLPEFNGLEIQSLLAARHVRVPLIFMSGQGDVLACTDAMRQGAIDFLVKPIDSRDLVAAVSRALVLDQAIQQRRREIEAVRAELAHLTARERQVCNLVATGRSNREIATELGVSEKMIKVHRGRGMHKLQLDSVAALVRLIDRARDTDDFA